MIENVFKRAYEAHFDYSENPKQLINLYLNLAYGASKITWSYQDVHIHFDTANGVYNSKIKVRFNLSAYTAEELDEKGVYPTNYWLHIPLGAMPNWKNEEDIDTQYLTYIADKEIKRYFEEEFHCDYYLEKLLPKEEKTFKEKLKRYNEIEKIIHNQELDRPTLMSPKNPIELWTWNQYTHQELPF